MDAKTGRIHARIWGRVDILSRELKSRGDVKGILGRIADLERALGSHEVATDNRKRITMSQSIFEPPIKILGISIGKDSVSLEESLPSRPDWLKGLAFRIKNTSGKTINRISLDLAFSETMAMGNMVMGLLSYGPHPLSAPVQNKPTNQTPIAPDAILEISLSEIEFASIKRSLAASQGMDA